ncbi:hypothetical protein FB459_1971 [Yimella lutea]|uniref:Uncharacterized protein n=1 Tax=Yimella lutea TaxID=587872 RepID=A0A542EGR9_9MICO|nr:hypothetical protein [Yimella lutea]TQJ14504.1 hypothetical protein FB459_1971 [Yimella lutea]
MGMEGRRKELLRQRAELRRELRLEQRPGVSRAASHQVIVALRERLVEIESELRITN